MGSKRARRYRQHSGADKVAILRKVLLEEQAVSAVCEEHDISPTLFYTWQKQFFENGTRAFNGGPPDRTESKLEKQIAHLEQRLVRKHEVLSELMEEHIRLKKDLGES